MAFIVKAGPTGRGELYYLYMFNNKHVKYFLGAVLYVSYLCCQGLGGCEIIIRSWWGERIFILYMEGDMEYILDYLGVVLQ